MGTGEVCECVCVPLLEGMWCKTLCWLARLFWCVGGLKRALVAENATMFVHGCFFLLCAAGYS